MVKDVINFRSDFHYFVDDCNLSPPLIVGWASTSEDNAYRVLHCYSKIMCIFRLLLLVCCAQKTAETE